MRIAVYHNQPSGGARRALYEMGKRLASRHEVDVYTLTTSDEAFLSSADFAREVFVFPFDRRRPRRFGLYLNELREFRDLDDLEAVSRTVADRVDRGGYDVLLADACRFVQSPSVLTYIRTPSVYYCHEPPRRFIEPSARPGAAPLSLYQRARAAWHWPARALYDRRVAALDRRNVAAAARVLTNSESSRQTVERYYGRAAAVCRLGVDAERFVPGDHGKSDYVLSVGALEPHKGFDFIVQALARCPYEVRPRLVVAGNTDDAGVSDHLRRLGGSLGVQVSIRVRISEAELLTLYQQARAFVYAPHREPFGLAVLEAMACGLPVIAVADGGPRESVADGTTGYLVARDETAFADALMRVLGEPGLAARLGMAGRELVVADWTWDAAANRLQEHLVAAAERQAVAA